jgi:hypothetical protein
VLVSHPRCAFRGLRTLAPDGRDWLAEEKPGWAQLARDLEPDARIVARQAFGVCDAMHFPGAMLLGAVSAFIVQDIVPAPRRPHRHLSLLSTPMLSFVCCAGVESYVRYYLPENHHIVLSILGLYAGIGIYMSLSGKAKAATALQNTPAPSKPDYRSREFPLSMRFPSLYISGLLAELVLFLLFLDRCSHRQVQRHPRLRHRRVGKVRPAGQRPQLREVARQHREVNSLSRCLWGLMEAKERETSVGGGELGSKTTMTDEVASGDGNGDGRRSRSFTSFEDGLTY